MLNVTLDGSKRIDPVLFSAPAEPGPDFSEMGKLALARGDSAMALQLWGKHREHHPLDVAGYLLAAGVLKDLMQLDAAEEILVHGRARCPDDTSLMTEHAWIAHHRGDWQTACERWQPLVERAPSHAVFAGMVHALMELQRFDQAEAQLAPIVASFPDDQYFATMSAAVATKRQDLHEALRRWQIVQTIKPDCPIAAAHLDVIGKIVADQQAAINERERANSDHPWEPAKIERISDPDAYALMLKFESMGEVCEFGLVQRHFEAEPLGLLRWAMTSPDDLAGLLEARLEGLGDAANVTLVRFEKEHYVLDTRYRLQFHTWHVEDLPDEAAFLKKHAARIRWLREKMLEDLSDCAKVFVYKTKYQASEEQVQRIFSALRAHGPNRFLYITDRDESKEAGSLHCDETGLLRGYIRPTSGNWVIEYDDYISICKQAEAICFPSNHQAARLL